MAGWGLIMQELDLEIRHHSGKQSVNADALSRNPVPTSPDALDDQMTLVIPLMSSCKVQQSASINISLSEPLIVSCEFCQYRYP